MKKKEKKSLRKVLPFYKQNMKFVVLVLILSWVYAGLGFLAPVVEGKILASFTETDFNFYNILILASIYTIVRLVLAIVMNFWAKAVLRLNGNVDYAIKEKLVAKLIRLKTQTFDDVNSGIFVTRLNKDTSALSELFDEVTDDLSTVLINFGFVVYAFFMNYIIGIYIILEISILYLINVRATKTIIKYRKIYKDKDEKVVGLYGEILRGIRDIKNLNAKEQIEDISKYEQKDAIESGIDYVYKRRLWHRFMDIVLSLFSFGFIVLSCYLITLQMLTIATFLTLFIFRKNIRQLIQSFTNIKAKLAEGEVSAQRVFDIVDNIKYKEEIFGNEKVETLNGDITFDNVCFSYDNETPLFENLNFKIKNNTFVAFVGKSGEGKTSILELLSKNYEINSGKVYLDNHILNQLSQDSIRKNISVVSQEPYIFNMTIKENLLLAKKDATDEEIISACKKAQIDDFIQTKKLKYNSLVGENGVQLSGGQKQRIAIARAILKDSKIILLDEATSALDNESQQKIKDILFELSKSHTVVMIAHRLSTIQDADQIFVFDDHKIIDSGKHKELMKKCKIYEKLYKNEEKASKY